MSNDEIEEKWQKMLNDFLQEHSNNTKGMSEKEEKEYVKKNKLNEKIKKMHEDFIKKYGTQK